MNTTEDRDDSRFQQALLTTAALLGPDNQLVQEQLRDNGLNIEKVMDLDGATYLNLHKASADSGDETA